MKPALFYDTETTGIPDWREPSEAPHQPHLVQLGARLIDLDTRETVQTLDVIVRPGNWDIPTEASDVHGITTALATKVGVTEEKAVDLFLDMWRPEWPRIAHNESFDARILRIALKRYFPHEESDPIDMADLWKGGEAVCTADLATPVMKMPPTAKMLKAGFNKPKKPKLSEAYEFFLGKPLEGAHSALVDVDACIAVWWKLQEVAA